jgi:hypothetical protein
VISITACRTGLLDPTDGGMGGGDLGGDLAAPRDLAGVCQTHTIEFVTLSELTAIDPDPTLGRAIRVRIGVPLRDGCDVLGDVALDVVIGNATDFARISARVWKGSGQCGATTQVQRIVDVATGQPLSNTTLQVHDGAPGGTLAVMINPKPPTSANCMQKLATGAACTQSCQCGLGNDTAVCVGGGNGAACAISCSEDVDCPAAQPHCRQTPVGAGLTWVCDATPEGCCAQSCPFGQACASCTCAVSATAASRACQCDADCPAGNLCTSDLRCVTPCTTVHDCPAGQNVCGGGQCSSTT